MRRCLVLFGPDVLQVGLCSIILWDLSWPFCYPCSHGGGWVSLGSGAWPHALQGGEKLVWAESTIGNWIVITRLASMSHWGR